MTYSKLFQLSLVGLGLAVAGCKSTTNSVPYAQSLATMTADRDSFTATPEVDIPASGSAAYNGVANIGLDNGAPIETAAALGALEVNVNFGTDTLTGSITDFTYYDETPVSGSVTISNGVLTGNNTVSVGSGLTADAAGTVAGKALDMDVTGEFVGPSAEMMALWFHGKTDLSGGVGIAAR